MTATTDSNHLAFAELCVTLARTTVEKSKILSDQNREGNAANIPTAMVIRQPPSRRAAGKQKKAGHAFMQLRRKACCRERRALRSTNKRASLTQHEELRVAISNSSISTA
jgi:hypothetical protein